MKVLLSIKPEYADKIFSGEKKYEYRRMVFKNTEIKVVIVYATKPVGKIIGEFTIKEILRDSPERIWSKTKKDSGISEVFFNHYFHDRNHAFAIQIENYTLYDKSIDPYTIIENFFAPQSFRYLEDFDSPLQKNEKLPYKKSKGL